MISQTIFFIKTPYSKDTKYHGGISKQDKLKEKPQQAEWTAWDSQVIREEGKQAVRTNIATFKLMIVQILYKTQFPEGSNSSTLGSKLCIQKHKTSMLSLIMAY